jgi:hypothetical protein
VKESFRRDVRIDVLGLQADLRSELVVLFINRYVAISIRGSTR